MEENFSKEESFDLIAKMISRAKNEYRDNGGGWLLWGWLLFISSLASAILKQLDLGRYIGMVWNVMGLIVLIYFVYSIISRRKTAIVKTYVEDLLDKFAIGFFLSLITVIAGSAIMNASFAFGYYFILYAFWMYIYGSAIKFKPLILGAYINWIAAILIFIVDDFKYGMIISSFAVLIGYLIPGYMLRNQFKKSSKSSNGL